MPSADSRPGCVLTFFGPGCWMWQTDNDEEGVAGSREQALEDAKAAYGAAPPNKHARTEDT